MTSSIIEAVNVSKVLGSGPARVQALKNVSLALSGGNLTVLMGPSGSGKTTLLSILGCMLAPTHGTVRVCGTSIDGARHEALATLRRQHIGFVFQSYHLFATLTVAENVRLALDVRGERGREAMAKTEEVLANVGARSSGLSRGNSAAASSSESQLRGPSLRSLRLSLPMSLPPHSTQPMGVKSWLFFRQSPRSAAEPFSSSRMILGCSVLLTRSYASKTAHSLAKSRLSRSRAYR
jgi:ABC-type Fe3+/spermidine/putrescine transport system ATPase subunit